MKEEKLNQANVICPHKPKKFRLTLDGGLGELYSLELCWRCYNEQKTKFILKKEVLDI